jgi:hypothetical protein
MTFPLSLLLLTLSFSAASSAQAGLVAWCARWMREPSLEETKLLPPISEFAQGPEAFRHALAKVAAKDLDAPIERFSEWERFADFEAALAKNRADFSDSDEETLLLLFAQSRLRKMAVLDSLVDARGDPAIRGELESEAIEGRLAVKRLLARKSGRMDRRELMRLDTRFWMLLYDAEGKRRYDLLPATVIGQRPPFKNVTDDPLRRDPYYRILDEFPRELQPLWLR